MPMRLLKRRNLGWLYLPGIDSLKRNFTQQKKLHPPPLPATVGMLFFLGGGGCRSGNLLLTSTCSRFRSDHLLPPRLLGHVTAGPFTNRSLYVCTGQAAAISHSCLLKVSMLALRPMKKPVQKGTVLDPWTGECLCIKRQELKFL